MILGCIIRPIEINMWALIMRFNFVSKTFNDSSDTTTIIRTVNITVSILRDFSIEILCLPTNKNTIITSLSNAGIPLQASNMSSVFIKAPRTAIRNALHALRHDGLMSPTFVSTISSNFPDGFGGVCDLDGAPHILDIPPLGTLFGRPQNRDTRTYSIPMPSMDMDEMALRNEDGTIEAGEDMADIAAMLISVDDDNGRITDSIRRYISYPWDDGETRRNISQRSANNSQTIALSTNGTNGTNGENTMWTKRGNFATTYNSGGPLNRSCTYINRSANATISELFLGGYRDNDYQIRAEASSEMAYNRLKQAIVNAGFPEPDFIDDVLKTVSVSTGDRNRLCHFLNAIKQEETTFSEIEAEVFATVEITSNVAVRLSTWNRSGSFTSTYNSGAGLNRQVNYTTGAPDSLVKQFCMFGYVDNEFMFTITLSESAAQLRQILVASELPLQLSEYYGDDIRLRFNASSRETFNQLVTLLSQHSTHFAEIAEGLKQHVAPVIAVNTVPRMRLFSGTTSNLSSVVKGNEDKLDAIGFSEEALTSEKEMYKKFCCSIGMKIMTNPVFDPRYPQYQFDKSEILRWLAIKQEHPFNRANLKACELMPNVALKQEIDKFVDDTVTAFHQRTFSPK